jgi:uncharacterized protein (TIGR00661 family)
MSRIIYSCCGEGHGHSSRVFAVAQALIRRGHQVKILTSHNAFVILRESLPDVQEIPGMALIYRKNRVKILPSLWRNLPLLAQYPGAVRQICRLIESWQPHLAISDFEPFLPRAARSMGLRRISLCHQKVIPYLRLQLPIKQQIPALYTRATVRLISDWKEKRLVTSFFFPESNDREVEFFPPILRESVLSAVPRNDGHVVVYQTSNSFEQLPALLKKLPFKFKVFGYKNAVSVDGNVSYFPRSNAEFIREVSSAAWVLTNGGFTLMSEALYLGKPVFSIPVKGQFEQWLNAFYLQRLGYGMMCDDERQFDIQMQTFLNRLDDYRQNISHKKFLGNESVLARISEFLSATGTTNPIMMGRS